MIGGNTKAFVIAYYITPDVRGRRVKGDYMPCSDSHTLNQRLFSLPTLSLNGDQGSEIRYTVAVVGFSMTYSVKGVSYHAGVNMRGYLLFLLWSLVEVHSQSFPRLSFMGQTLANNTYVDISQVGNDGSGSDSVQCHTDLSTCCASDQGIHRGDWYFPNGDRLPFPTLSVDTYEARGAQRVDIRRNTNANSPTVGIYRCDIPTNAVHHATNISVRDAPVYVGLYTANGGECNIIVKSVCTFFLSLSTLF